MAVRSEQSARGQFYDDSLEPLTEIKKHYQKFSIKNRKYHPVSDKDTFRDEFSGGIPVLADPSEGAVYVDSQDSHTLVIGATGSKKTRLVVMPTVRLLGWAGESMIISDPKAEIYNRTADELEKAGYNIEVLNFRNPTVGSAWNPLSIPYQFYQAGDIDRACEMVNDMANNLLAADHTDKDPFWQNSAANLFFGLVLTLFKMCADEELSDMAVNIGNVLKLRRQLFNNLNPAASPIWNYIKEDEIIAPALSGIVLTAKDTRAGITSTFDQKVRYFVFQPNLMDMLSNDSNVLAQIEQEKTAVFLIMPDEKTTFHPLISLFIKQSYEYLIYKAQLTKEGRMKIRLNYILDEFSSLPTIKDFPTMITAARSRNIRFCLIIQSKHQLKQRYENETETIQSNCVNWVFLTSREVPLLEEISTLCGTKCDGRIPLISVFALQHLDKEKGQALMLCGRKRPYYAQLFDIDTYDGGHCDLRDLTCDSRRSRRIDIDGIEIAKKYADVLAGEDETKFEENKFTNFNGLDFLLNQNTELFNEYLKNKMAALDEEDETFVDYYTEFDKGNQAYGKGDYEEAKAHFIAAESKWSKEDGANEAQNNLGYMLRRGEIKDIIIDGICYDVPQILKSGVEEQDSFALVNMALFVSVTEDGVELEKGKCYIEKMQGNDTAAVKAWWEDLAKKGELEGYVVLEWLYEFDMIKESCMGTKAEIERTLKEIFGVTL